MDNMMLGRYVPIQSFIHKLDPRLKISALMLLLIAVFFDSGFIGYTILGLYVAIIAFLSKIKFKDLIKAIKPMFYMMQFLIFIL